MPANVLPSGENVFLHLHCGDQQLQLQLPLGSRVSPSSIDKQHQGVQHVLNSSGHSLVILVCLFGGRPSVTCLCPHLQEFEAEWAMLRAPVPPSEAVLRRRSLLHQLHRHRRGLRVHL